MVSSVAVLAYEGVSTFGLGVTAEIFGCDRSAEGLPRYDYSVTAATPGVIRTDVGLPIVVEAGLDRFRAADLGIVVCWDQTAVSPPEATLTALRDLAGRGGRVLSHCTGAFVLAAGIDACLHLVRQEHGATVANAIARRMVVPPHRDGGQAQFITPLVEAADDAADGGMAAVHTWALAHLDEPITVIDLAARALMSPRNFARQFVARSGTTPHQWLISQRLLRAQELLEHSQASIEQVAGQCGLTPLMLRRHFARRYATTPQAYRRTFSQADPAT